MPHSSWTLDSYRVRTWAYHVLPTVGARVHYISDGFESRVKCIHWDHICMTDGIAFRRRLEPRRLWRWMTAKIRPTSSGSAVAPSARPLKPSMPYVAVVNLQL